MDAFKRVTAGTKLDIPAAAYNAMLDAAVAHRRSGSQGAEAIPTQRHSGILKVKNATGAALARFAVLGLGEPVVAPADNEQEFARQVTFEVVQPTEDIGYAVLLEPVDDNAIGSAIAAGIVPVQLSVGDTTYDYAEATGTHDYLVNVPHGTARVLWIESGTAPVRWAIVRLDDGDQEAVVYITSNIPDGQGRYPGIVQRYIAGGWVSQYACKVMDLNG